MERLLRDEDCRYLASQGNFSLSQIRKIRAQRRCVFRQYLTCLCDDFASLGLLVRVLIVQSEVSRPDLAKALLRSRIIFGIALLKVEYSLMSHALGFPVDQMDVSTLVGALGRIRVQVGAFQISAQPTFA